MRARVRSLGAVAAAAVVAIAVAAIISVRMALPHPPILVALHQCTQSGPAFYAGTEQHYGGDPSQVYVTGASSGAMMTNVLLGDYPDVFKAGAAFMGVPFGCFAGPGVDVWNSACADGQISMPPQQWG